ncbi:MFS transporter [Acetobacteraceae bacterium KSS8]|uniref:MFS transporter n=1 Tax=Endosaccharibacter trunci TaxID=2812733 RepID=A0ABT1W3V0_9PROT|nr:MFS transporter [Acetobacteraceae bacterium KSS8]
MRDSTRTDPLSPQAVASRSPVHVVAACYLGWMLDSFDFFIMVFVLNTVAKTFGVGVDATVGALTATLACRVIGAALFGRLADRFGRRPVMMINVLSYATLELLSGFAPSFTVFLILRALFGVAMGGEWGVGASLAMESIPGRWRGLVSGILQTGYPTGYLLASLLFAAEPWLGWRGMFIVGALPALLVLYIRRTVPESPDWAMRETQAREPVLSVVGRHKTLTLYAVLLLTAMLFFSHGSQDLYPSQLLSGFHHLPHRVIVWMMVSYNVGAIAGGLAIGSLSQRIGRRKALAGAALLALPAIPLWAFGDGILALAVGGFVLQFAVQGAWGVIPAFLNEISPEAIRATFPGVVYQLGNLLASPNANIQIWLSKLFGGDIRWSLAIVIATVSVLVAVLTAFARETRDVRMGMERRT